jgi:hypothetical protein
MDPFTEALTQGLGGALFAAGVLTFAWSRRLVVTVGPTLHRELSRRGLRAVLLAGVMLLAGLVVLGGFERAPAPLVFVLAGVALVLLFSPGFRDSVYGEKGVRYGWYARRFEQLEEWRLTGEHLRWKLFGEWVACRVPPAEQAALRERLERLCPGRECRFTA